MGTTKKLQLRKDLSYNINIRANGKYDYTNVYKFTRDNEQLSINMQDYDGLKYTINKPSGEGTTILDFSKTVLPWKFEMNNYLARTRYCWKPYREEPYQVEMLKPEYNNVSIVGTPTINGNVVSGFSRSNYLHVDNKYKSTNNTEYVFKFTTGSDVSTAQVIVHSELLFNLEMGGACINFYNFGSGVNTTFIENISINVTYWVKVFINGTSKTYSYSTDGITYIGEVTVIDTGMQPNNTSYNFRLGLSSYTRVNPFLGSVDLSESHVLIDGTKYNLSDAAYVKQWNLNTYGDIVVSDDGVISNFSSSNYVSVNNVHINTEEELLLAFRTSDDVSSEQVIFRSDENYLALYIQTNGHMGIWNVSQGEEVFLTNVSPNTEYYVKFRFLEDNNIEVGLSINGSNYEWQSFRDTTVVYTDTAEYLIGKHSEYGSGYFRGTFDYNKSDIPQTGGKLKTEELYGIIDGEEYSVYLPSYCYVNKDQNLIVRQNKIEKINDITDWYLGEINLGE